MEFLLFGLFFGIINVFIVRSKGYLGIRAFIGGITLGLISTIYCLFQPLTTEYMVKKEIEYQKVKEKYGIK